ncbi:MAG: LLM class oxidoreductase [Planctomycetota bacterium]
MARSHVHARAENGGSGAASSAAPRTAAAFPSINRGYDSIFRSGRLSLGLVVPLESYVHSSVPTMTRHVERVQLAEELGFGAVWLRDVPFHVPSFGDAGQTFDPFVYLGLLAGSTDRIALGTASIVLPLRHPAHVAKAAATADVLSGGRLVLGVASGDRPEEYPALARPFEDRGARFRSSFEYIRSMGETFPAVDGEHGTLNGTIDMLPKPTAGRLPMLVTGASRQDPDWLAANGDGWMTYPRSVPAQGRAIDDFRARIRAAGQPDKPVMQPLYVDLADDHDAPPQPIHLGFRLGVRPLVTYLRSLEEAGVNHVALNLRFQRTDVEETMRRLAAEVLPTFHVSD